MVIRQINIFGLTILKLKYDAPVAGDINGIKIAQVSMSFMQAITRLAHMFDRFSSVKLRKDTRNLLNMVRVDFAAIPMLKKAF